MKKIILSLPILLIITTLCLVFLGCADKTYVSISAEQAKVMMDGEDVIIIDVREGYEYSEGHIDGAILIPLGSIYVLASELIPDKSSILLVYCRSGRRSKEGAVMLVNLGYVNVYEFGGIIDWPYELIAD